MFFLPVFETYLWDQAQEDLGAQNRLDEAIGFISSVKK